MKMFVQHVADGHFVEIEVSDNLTAEQRSRLQQAMHLIEERFRESKELEVTRGEVQRVVKLAVYATTSDDAIELAYSGCANT